MHQPVADDHSRREPVNRLFIESFRINWDVKGLNETYLSNIPAIRNTDELVFHKNITFFVGENGSGKSTLLEALAIANGLNPEGGTQNFHFSTYDDYSENGCSTSAQRYQTPMAIFSAGGKLL